ncbi:MAG TPA: CaiB/BaiF CoA-transferase family protein [Candidatus Saccharimonadales bacterium]|nr:CaiB/BaiF CoA-transferase family protein [Candidatus Saccharimonadales bacterium]
MVSQAVQPTSPGPLAGVRILDLSRILSGPFATMVFADLGADVIKLENPRTGDDTREWAPPYQGDQSAYFLSVNRNKRGIAVDLKTSRGREIALRLADLADVVVENFRPGTAGRLGLGYDDLSARNPRLIYASISGFGQTGPYRSEPGYDAIAQALGGLMSVTGEADGEPVRVGNSAADLGASMWAAIGILAALHARHSTGRGEWIDVSLLDGQIASLTYLAGGYFASGEVPRRYGSAHPSIVPYQALRTADGHLMVAVGNDTLWQRFAPLIGLPELVDDPRFVSNPERVANRRQLIPLIETALATRTSAAWAEELSRVGIPAGAINSVDAALEHPQVRAREMVLTTEHPTAGTLRMTGSPIKLSRHTASVRRPPPLLGQHTDEVLGELGYSTADIATLRDEGVVR